mgnify:CR=1 FL=1
METLLITWEIGPERYEAVDHYCPGCGRKVKFQDSLKRRRNANGKKVYEYAIYKCERGHTWNRLLDRYGAKNYIEDGGSVDLTTDTSSLVEIIQIKECLRKGFTEIEISIKKIEGSWRLDKLLAYNFEGISRSRIEKMIKSSRILVDNETVKSKTTVKEGQKILFSLT